MSKRVAFLPLKIYWFRTRVQYWSTFLTRVLLPKGDKGKVETDGLERRTCVASRAEERTYCAAVGTEIKKKSVTVALSCSSLARRRKVHHAAPPISRPELYNCGVARVYTICLIASTRDDLYGSESLHETRGGFRRSTLSGAHTPPTSEHARVMGKEKVMVSVIGEDTMFERGARERRVGALGL